MISARASNQWKHSIKSRFLLFTLNDAQDKLTVVTTLRSPTHLLFKTFCLQRAANQKKAGLKERMFLEEADWRFNKSQFNIKRDYFEPYNVTLVEEQQDRAVRTTIQSLKYASHVRFNNMGTTLCIVTNDRRTSQRSQALV